MFASFSFSFCFIESLAIDVSTPRPFTCQPQLFLTWACALLHSFSPCLSPIHLNFVPGESLLTGIVMRGVKLWSSFHLFSFPSSIISARHLRLRRSRPSTSLRSTDWPSPSPRSTGEQAPLHVHCRHELVLSISSVQWPELLNLRPSRSSTSPRSTDWPSPFPRSTGEQAPRHVHCHHKCLLSVSSSYENRSRFWL